VCPLRLRTVPFVILNFITKSVAHWGVQLRASLGQKSISLAQSAPTPAASQAKTQWAALPKQTLLFSLSLATQVQLIWTAIFDRNSADICYSKCVLALVGGVSRRRNTQSALHFPWQHGNKVTAAEYFSDSEGKMHETHGERGIPLLVFLISSFLCVLGRSWVVNVSTWRAPRSAEGAIVLIIDF
jgi:hypothetical protein